MNECQIFDTIGLKVLEPVIYAVDSIMFPDIPDCTARL